MESTQRTAEPVQQTIERLLAIEEIKQLKARYWRHMDRKEWDPYAELFEPEATLVDYTTGFRCDGREEVRSKVSTLLQGVISVHHGHQPEIFVDDGVHARGIWAFQDVLLFPADATLPTDSSPVSEIRGSGHYFDRYSKASGEWRFSSVGIYRLNVETTARARTPYPTPDEFAPAGADTEQR